MLKKLLFFITIVVMIFSSFVTAHAYVNVRGYYRSNGTYVSPHVRSNPNGLKYDNYSYKAGDGLYNKTYGTKGSEWDTPTYVTDPDYYTGKSLYESGLSGSTYSASSLSNTTCPVNSYAFDGMCKCNYGYIVSGSSCVSASLYCSNTIGLMSQYNSITSKCECMSGYEYNGSTCVYKSSKNSYSSTYSNVSTCPLNSHISLTDSSKCQCNTGYQVNTAKDACVLSPLKTYLQSCQDNFGLNSLWNGELNENKNPLCICMVGYQWSIDRKSCTAKPAL